MLLPMLTPRGPLSKCHQERHAGRQAASAPLQSLLSISQELDVSEYFFRR